jgi:hypothetical protein
MSALLTFAGTEPIVFWSAIGIALWGLDQVHSLIEEWWGLHYVD